MIPKILHTVRRIPYLSILLTAAAVLIHVYYFLRPNLIYSRTAINGGDLWRLVSCHWVHLNADHLLWSSMTFLLLGSLCEIIDRGKYVLALGVSSVLIPSAIWAVMPQLEFYGGLSGLDCALYTLLIVLIIQREWRTRNPGWIIFYIIMLVLLPAKIIYELTSGLTIFVNNIDTNMIPVPLAHLAGGIVGFAAGMVKGPGNFCSFRLAYIHPTM